jgi:TetR/AcrR family transcriptional regulator, cholesterol catabolism regulator
VLEDLAGRGPRGLLHHHQLARRLVAGQPLAGKGAQVLQTALVRTRDAYEDVFRDLVGAVSVRPGVDRSYLRLTLLGAINWTLIWYRPGGGAPATIAQQIVTLIRQSAER